MCLPAVLFLVGSWMCRSTSLLPCPHVKVMVSAACEAVLLIVSLSHPAQLVKVLLSVASMMMSLLPRYSGTSTENSLVVGSRAATNFWPLTRTRVLVTLPCPPEMVPVMVTLLEVVSLMPSPSVFIGVEPTGSVVLSVSFTSGNVELPWNLFWAMSYRPLKALLGVNTLALAW